ncbi:MAG: hypothetical protein V1897_01080, partial [Pseudomonadota bacterium]
MNLRPSASRWFDVGTGNREMLAVPHEGQQRNECVGGNCMEAPDLTRIVDTFVPIADDYFGGLRQDVIPFIRDLQGQRKLRW